jgi:hypothetical protein
MLDLDGAARSPSLLKGPYSKMMSSQVAKIPEQFGTCDKSGPLAEAAAAAVCNNTTCFVCCEWSCPKVQQLLNLGTVRQELKREATSNDGLTGDISRGRL